MKKPNTSKARLDLPASQGIGYWVGEHFTVVLTDKTIIFCTYLYRSVLKLFQKYYLGGMHDC